MIFIAVPMLEQTVADSSAKWKSFQSIMKQQVSSCFSWLARFGTERFLRRRQLHRCVCRFKMLIFTWRHLSKLDKNSLLSVVPMELKLPQLRQRTCRPIESAEHC